MDGMLCAYIAVVVLRIAAAPPLSFSPQSAKSERSATCKVGELRLGGHVVAGVLKL